VLGPLPPVLAAIVLTTAVAGTATAVLATVATVAAVAAEVTGTTVPAAPIVVTVGDVFGTALDGVAASLRALLAMVEAGVGGPDGPLDEDVWLTLDRFLAGEPSPTPFGDAARLAGLPLLVEVGRAVPDGLLDEDLLASRLAEDAGLALFVVDEVCELLDTPVDDELLAPPPEGDDEPAEPVVSACATPDSPANTAAPIPSVIAPAPSHA
jgi:hypothetical protein